METVIGFLLGLGFLFWIVVAVIISSIFYNDDKGTSSLVWFFLSAIFLFFIFGEVSLAGLKAFAISIVTFSPIYLGIGLAWSLVRWILLQREVSRVLIVVASSGKAGRDNEGFKYALEEHFGRYSYPLTWEQVQKNDFIISLGKAGNRSRVFRWIAMWPMSVVNYTFRKLIVDLIDTIIDCLRRVYDGLSRLVASRIDVPK